jgi:hypothetical protein
MSNHLKSHRRFVFLLIGLCIFYAAWMIACWPGILGQDSLAIMLEVETNRQFQANKPVFWYLYNFVFYGPWRLVQVPIILQLLACALICARILDWMLAHNMWKSFWYCLFGVALAPSVVFYTSSLYSDGIYAIATAGMLFEVWRSYREHKFDSAGIFMLFLTIPFSLFSRPNGLINGIALLVLMFVLSRKDRRKFLMVVLPWCILIGGASVVIKYRNPIGTIYPLTLYETVGFLEHRPMGLWEHGEPRVTPDTIAALTSTGEDIDKISKFYDHYYWDPLIFFPQGPALLGLPQDAKRIIIREFFKYNLWHNFPAFAASRVNIFFYSMFADGGFPGITNAENILPQTESHSEIRFRGGATHNFLTKLFDLSFKYRVIFWTPWVGLYLIIFGNLNSWRRRDRAGGIVCATLLIQLFLVFGFSIAGEYRYLLAFFTAPLVLLPAIYAPSISSPHA